MTVAVQRHRLLVVNEAGDAVFGLLERGMYEQSGRRITRELRSGGKVQGKKRKNNCQG
jgi:hypothetical protein